MKSIRIHETGGREQMRYEDADKPVPKSGEVLIKVAASGVNFIDVYHRSGLYKQPVPFTLGLEGAGTVEALGAGVTTLTTGDHVAWSGIQGSYAEFVTASVSKLVKVPGSLDLKMAAAVMLQGMTAHYLTHSTYPLKPGDSLLIHAAAGGVGLLLIQLAKTLGARVIGTVSTEEKSALAREAGADDVILYTQQDFEPEVKRLTDGKGVNVVYDSVGATTFFKSINCLQPRGMMVTFGQSSGPVGQIDLLLLSQKGSLYLTRPSLAAYTATPEELNWRANDLFSAIGNGKLNVRLEHVYKLSEAAKAHEDLEGRKTTGKLLLLP